MVAATTVRAPYSVGFAERLARMAERPKLDVQVCDHCNLRCAGCLHFAPLAEERFLDVDEYERDLSRLASIDGIEGYFGTVVLMGGEPLLHPRIADIVRVTRARLPGQDVVLCTNGLLLRRMGDGLWRALAECDVGLLISPYPLRVDYEGLAALARERGVLAAFAVVALVAGAFLWNGSSASEGGLGVREALLLAALFAQFAQLVFVAGLLRLLPVPDAPPPAPDRGPEDVWPHRVLRVVLVLAALLAVRCVWNGVDRFLRHGDAMRFAPPPVNFESVDWDAVTVVRGPRDAGEWIERPGWTDEDRALLAVWGHSLQEENGTIDPFFLDPADDTVELSGDGFTVIFAGDRLVAFLGRRTIARRLDGFDLEILDMLRHVTPSPDADEPRAESAEGAEP